jgi:hypothetical protein
MGAHPHEKRPPAAPQYVDKGKSTRAYEWSYDEPASSAYPPPSQDPPNVSLDRTAVPNVFFRYKSSRHPGGWASRQLRWSGNWDIIARLSPDFEIHALRVSHYPDSYTWVIDYPHSVHLGHDAVGILEEVVQKPRISSYIGLDVWDRPVQYSQKRQNLNAFSEYSNILWNLHIVPERLWVPWQIYDSATGVNLVAKAPPMPPQRSSHILKNTTSEDENEDGDLLERRGFSQEDDPVSPARSSKASRSRGDSRSIQSHSSGECCWNKRRASETPSTQPQELLRLANASLIHGWEETLVTAIVPLIWDYTAPEPALNGQPTSETFVDWFKRDGENGLASMHPTTPR